MDIPSDGLGWDQPTQDDPPSAQGPGEEDVEQMRSLVAGVPEPFVVARQSGEIVTGNSSFGAFFEQERSTLDGTHLTDLLPDLTREAVEENCTAAAGESVTCRGVRGSGEECWVNASFDHHQLGSRTYLVGAFHDVTERRQRIQQLEQYERIVETIDDGVYTLDESFTIESVNSAVESMTGYDQSELLGASASLLADESVLDRAAKLSAELQSGDREVATLTADLETTRGETLPIETRFSTYSLDDGQHRQVGVVRDISDQRAFERMLAALHETTRELLTAQTTNEVSRLVVESATNVLELCGAAIYQFDRDENTLRPVSVSEHFEESAADGTVEPGGSPLWDVFLDGGRVTVGPSDDPLAGSEPNGGHCLSLGEFGVFYAVTEAREEIDTNTTEVLELLAASAQAALARVDREQSLRDRDETLREQNRQLRRLEEVNTIIRRIDQVLVEATTCAEIEQAVCDQIVASPGFDFAWIGRVDASEIEPTAWAGSSPSYLDDVSLDTAAENGPPATQTAASETVTVVPAVAEGLQNDHWRAEAISRDFRSVISIPLQYEAFTYGVLTVYASEQSAFGEMLQTVFVELGETIANAIQSVRRRQRRSADTALEVTLSLSAPTDPLGRIAASLDSAIRCEDAVLESDGQTRLFFTLVDGDAVSAAALRERVSALTCVESLTAIADEEAPTRFEAVVSCENIARSLLDQGALIGSIEADSDGESLEVTVRLSTGVDVRQFIDSLGDAYEDVQLVARREREDIDRTASGVRTVLTDELTDRQLQVLRTAYLSGFFDWPRKSSGQDLADRLDVSQPTISRHVRLGERSLFELVFGES